MQKMQELDSQAPSNSEPPAATAPAPAPNNQAPTATTPPTENQTPETPAASAPAPEPAAASQMTTPTEPSVAPAPEMTPSATATEAMPQTPASSNSTPTEQSVATPAPADIEPQTQSAPVETMPATAVPTVAPTNENSIEAEEQAIVSQRQGAQSPQAPMAPPIIAPNTNTLPVMNEMVPPPAQAPAPMPVPQEKRGFFSRILHPFGLGRANHPAVVEVQHQPEASAKEKNNSGFAPIQPPPPPVSPEQDAQLQALLQKYEADQISPQEYQTERAAIIGNQ
jgi:hypothetical protein